MCVLIIVIGHDTIFITNSHPRVKNDKKNLKKTHTPKHARIFTHERAAVHSNMEFKRAIIKKNELNLMNE